MRGIGRLLGASLLLLASGASAQETDPPGVGVLCRYMIFAGAMLDAEVCGWYETATGQAIRQSLDDMESYMLANSSEPEMVERIRSNYAAGVASMRAMSEEQATAYCEGLDPERPNYFGAMKEEDPKELLATTHEMLRRPGEPTYGNCL